MMILHKVQAGDTIASIATMYDISVQKLMEDNELMPDGILNVGQMIAIVHPSETYTVKAGDSLFSIAEENNIPVMELLRNNAYLSDRSNLRVGEELIIRYEDGETSIRVNGMAYSFIDDEILRKTLPFLTYITIMGSRVEIDANITDTNDERIIQMSLAYGVIPLMLVYGITDTGQGSAVLTHTILNSQELQDRLIANLIDRLSTKGYYGAVFGFQYVRVDDRQLYTDFIIRASNLLHELGFLTGAVLIPDTFGYVPGSTANSSYYRQIGASVDGVILLSYQWSTGYIPQVYQSAYSYLRDYVEFAISQIPPEKIYLGLSRVAYDWELPYVEGESFVSSLTNQAAIALANQYGSEIFFDELTQIPYFEYRVGETTHLVWFKDIRYVNAILELVNTYGLGGVSIWNIMYYFRIWLVLNSQYQIEKELPPLL